MRRFIDIVSPKGPQPQRVKLLSELERIDESKRAYETMMVTTKKLVDQFAKGYEANALPLLRRLTTYETWAHEKLRQDRAVWFLRELRLAAMWDLKNFSDHTYPQETEGWEDFKKAVFKYLEKLLFEYKRQTGKDFETYGEPQNHPRFLREQIEHFQGVPYSKLKTYVFTMDKTWAEIDHDLKTIENEFIERARGKLTMKPGDEVILTLPDNYVWVKLNRAACQDEANAMGHCGNSPRSGTGDRILSLRRVEEEIDGVQYMTPCLTFILHVDGYLGEMKGRGNLKPAEHYHDQIEALLRSEHIKGIRGGGYLAQNNFSVNQMDHERGEALLAHNPNLITPKETYQRYGLNENLIATLKSIYDTEGWVVYAQKLASYEIDQADQRILNEEYGLCSPAVSYQRGGLTDSLINQIRIAFSKRGQPYHVSYKDDAPVYVRAWFNQQNEGTSGFTVENMKPEERKRLFEAVPKVMLPKDEYDLHGLTDEFLFKTLGAVAAQGQYHFVQSGIDPTEWSPKDQNKLATTSLAELGTKLSRDAHTGSAVAQVQEQFPTDHDSWAFTPEQLCQFRWWNQHYGDDSQGDLFPDDLPETSLRDKIDFAIEHWGDPNEDSPRQDENDDWVFGEWDNCEEFVEAITDKDSDLRDVVKVERDFQQDDRHWPQGDDYELENFGKYLPIQDFLSLRGYALRLRAKNEGDLEDDEAEDVDDWKSIWAIIDEYDDDLSHTIKSAVESGYVVGTEAEMVNSGLNCLASLKPKAGSVRYSLYNGHIQVDQPVTWVMTTEQLCEFFDRKFPGGSSLGPENYFNVSFNAPSYGWNEFDSEAAVERYHEECPEELDGEDNPYWPNKYPENYKALSKMSAKQLRKKIDEIERKCIGWNGFQSKVPEGDDPQKLKQYLLWVATKYYG